MLSGGTCGSAPYPKREPYQATDARREARCRLAEYNVQSFMETHKDKIDTVGIDPVALSACLLRYANSTSFNLEKVLRFLDLVKQDMDSLEPGTDVRRYNALIQDSGLVGQNFESLLTNRAMNLHVKIFELESMTLDLSTVERKSRSELRDTRRLLALKIQGSLRAIDLVDGLNAFIAQAPLRPGLAAIDIFKELTFNENLYKENHYSQLVLDVNKLYRAFIGKTSFMNSIHSICQIKRSCSALVDQNRMITDDAILGCITDVLTIRRLRFVGFEQELLDGIQLRETCPPRYEEVMAMAPSVAAAEQSRLAPIEQITAV